MRQVFAFAVLVACVRLGLALNTVTMESAVAEVDKHDAGRKVTEVEEPWLEAVEGILNGPSPVSRDSRFGPAVFQSGRR